VPDDTEQLFLGLLVQRGLAPRELVAECLDGAARGAGRSAMHLVVERARIPTDVARALHGEAAAMVRDGRGRDLARFLSSSGTGAGGQAVATAPRAATGSFMGVPPPGSVPGNPSWGSGSGWPQPPGSNVWAGNQADAPTPPSSAFRPTHAGPLGATQAGATAWGTPTPGAMPAVGRTAATFEPGQVFGRYRLERELGRGGMGVVWRSRQIDLDRPVAIKMLLSGALGDERRRARFLAEARAVARMSHPNIVGIFDVGEQDGVLFFTMELVDGPSLSELLKQGKVELKRALDLGAGIADGLSYAHSLQLIHRDLKPANILIDPRGIPKITDFGIAKDLTSTEAHTVSGEVLGTPAYMPPEQANGRKDIDHRADVYALGAIVYRMVCAAPPFDGATAYDVIAKVLSAPPQPPSKLEPTCPQDVEDVILRCLAKDREQRYPDAGEVATALRDARRTLDGPAKGTRRARGGGGGSKTAIVVLATLLVVVVGGGGVAWKLHADEVAADLAAAAAQADAEQREAARLVLEKEAALRRASAESLVRDALERARKAPDEALALARKAGEAGPDSAEVQAGLGVLLRSVARDARAASAAFARALELDGQRVDARAGRARCLLDLGRPATEVEAEADALDRLGPAGRTEGAGLRADIALTRDELSVAIVHLDEAVKGAAGSARLRLRLAQLLLRARRYASAEEEADAALRIDDKSATALAIRAAARKELGRAPDALKDAEAALRLDEKEPLALQVARELRQRVAPPGPGPGPRPTAGGSHGDHDSVHKGLAAAAEALRKKDQREALRLWQTALEPADLDCPAALVDRIQIGLALRLRELVPKLGEDINRLMRIQGKQVEGLLFAADIYLLNGQEKDVPKVLEQAVTIDPRAWEPFHLRAIWWEKHGDLVKARADFDRIGELAPTDGWAVHERAHFLARHEEFQAALVDLDRAISLVPDKVHLFVTRGDVLVELSARASSPSEVQELKRKARADFEKALELHGTSPANRETEHARQRLTEMR